MEIDDSPPAASTDQNTASSATNDADASTSSRPRPNPATSSEADPIVASYNVYTNPSLPASRQLLILQHPNKKLTSHETYASPAVSEVRIKPRAGMIELDTPLSHVHADYDRDKGLRWGVALARSTQAKNGGSHGLSGGFGVGVPAIRGGGGGRKKADDDGLAADRDLDMADWAEAVRQDKVLRTQTLGGQFPVEADSNCRWMVGIFQGDQLHLTPATSVIHLRPQMHHLDASTEQERTGRPREGAAGGASAGPGGAAGAAGAAGKESAGRAITMSIKSAGGAEVTQETMTDRLRVVQTEPWSRLRHEADDSDRAWDMYHENLVYRPAEPDSQNADGKIKDSAGKGKEKAVDERTALENAAPRLQGVWAEAEFLRAVSGRSGLGDEDGDAGFKAAAEAKRESEAAVKKEEGASDPSSVAKGKGRAAPAAGSSSGAAAGKKTAASSSGKGKSVAFKGTAMEID